jgi:VIT1/CCC1 family predicted Fe2+/Mn2+ transporter
MTRPDKLPIRSAAVTFAAFSVMGLVPLLTYIGDALFSVNQQALFPIASVLTAVGFVSIGLLKGLVNQKSRLQSIAETLGLGIAAATLAYVAGYLLERLLA